VVVLAHFYDGDDDDDDDDRSPAQQLIKTLDSVCYLFSPLELCLYFFYWRG